MDSDSQSRPPPTSRRWRRGLTTTDRKSENAAERMGFHQIVTSTRPSRVAAGFGLGVATIEVTLLARPTESLVSRG